MSISPSLNQMISRARVDLRSGLPVALSTTGGIWLAVATEELTNATMAEMRALGAPSLALTAWRAQTLKARAYDGDLARLVLRDDMDAKLIRRLADPKDDLTRPLAGPFTSLREGDAQAARAALALLKSARLLPAAVMVEAADPPHGLTTLAAGDLLDAIRATPDHLPVVAGHVPMNLAHAGRVHVFRSTTDDSEHVAVEIGQPPRDQPVLTRLHSACFTGDVLGSLKCDCGPQLHAALGAMGQAGAGVLLYLDQEGRGIGLANKMRAYALQDQGFDTVEANHRLGFEDDERDFRVGADILRKLGFSDVRLMTNNPAKVAMMETCGISVVERVPLAVGRNPRNSDYLDTKAAKSGHIL